jgi:hypothetical protein
MKDFIKRIQKLENIYKTVDMFSNPQYDVLLIFKDGSSKRKNAFEAISDCCQSQDILRCDNIAGNADIATSYACLINTIIHPVPNRSIASIDAVSAINSD